MTEKRFTYKYFENTHWAYDNGEQIHTKEMVDLLNEQNETIQQLQKVNETLLRRNGRLDLEIEQLKQVVKTLKK